MSVNCPFFVLSLMIACTMLEPKPLMPPRPKRTCPSTLTEKAECDSFMSGLRTLMPLFLQSSMIFLISSIFERLLLRFAAWNSAG